MMTIKEISELTGVSTRTLRYYDSIGLFDPTEKSESGYRLYDAKGYADPGKAALRASDRKH